MKLETTTWFRTILVLAVLFCIGYGICLLSRDDEIAKTLSGIALISTGVFCFVWSLFPASSGRSFPGYSGSGPCRHLVSPSLRPLLLGLVL